MESAYLAILSSKGQLTLPKDLREQLDLKEGQRLLLEATQGGLLVKKAALTVSEDGFEDAEWQELKNMAAEKGKAYKSGKAFLRSLRNS